jgi:plastocyanin
MTQLLSGRIPARAALLVLAAVCALSLVPQVIATPEPAREVHLVVRDMRFYVEGDSTPNPTIVAQPGERLRIVLRNTDVGMSHDFAVRSWNVTTRVLKGKGEDAIEFVVPHNRGTHVYTCTPHAETMSGSIVVR